MELDTRARGRARRQRGFTLVDTLVAVAIATMMVVALGTSGARRAQTHAAGLALQAALVEARAVAQTTGDALDPLVPTGATIAIAPDPAADHGSVIRVYRSRPIVVAGLGGRPATSAVPLVPDVGFPAQRVAATFRLASAATGTIVPPLTILISQSGATSIVGGYAYDPAHARTFARDPGCDDRGVTIATDDGSSRTETYAFACRDAVLDVDRPVVSYARP